MASYTYSSDGRVTYVHSQHSVDVYFVFAMIAVGLLCATVIAICICCFVRSCRKSRGHVHQFPGAMVGANNYPGARPAVGVPYALHQNPTGSATPTTEANAPLSVEP